MVCLSLNVFLVSFIEVQFQPSKCLLQLKLPLQALWIKIRLDKICGLVFELHCPIFGFYILILAKAVSKLRLFCLFSWFRKCISKFPLSATLTVEVQTLPGHKPERCNGNCAEKLMQFYLSCTLFDMFWKKNLVFFVNVQFCKDLDLFKLKSLEEDIKLHVTYRKRPQKKRSLLKTFSPFPIMFSKVIFLRIVKSWDCV